MKNRPEANESKEDLQETHLPDMEAVDDYWYSLLPLPRKTFKKILEAGGKNAGNLLLLYMKYMDTARAQETNQPWATNRYIAKGLSWNRETVIKYNKLLGKMGMIKDITRKDKKGKITGHFMKIIGVPVKPIKQDSHSMELPECGNYQSVVNTDTNALTSKNEVLKLYNSNALRLFKQFKIPVKHINRAVKVCGEGTVIDWLERMEEGAKHEKLRNPTAMFLYYFREHTKT